MLRQTFCHIDGVSQSAERRLWDIGIIDWRDLQKKSETIFSERKMINIKEQLKESEEALISENFRYFLTKLPKAALPRIYPHCKNRLAYLDIETTGLFEQSRITTITVYDGLTIKTYVDGINLDKFSNDAESYDVMVTYNGTRFDLPFIKRKFGRLPMWLHIDLCPILHAWGSYGGLKASETRYGIKRTRNDCIDGRQAVELWNRYETTGDMKSLNVLLQYNIQDTLSLELILIALYNCSMNGCLMHRKISRPVQPNPKEAINCLFFDS